MSKPNIFDYATSELSQDAVLAYMLAWADLEHEETASLHKLGQDLLFAMLDKAGRNIQKIEKVTVRTQDNKIDVSVDINGEIFMIIEDKTVTMRHGDQILRYKDDAEKRGYSKEKGYDMLAIYLKTGNESKWFHPEPERASCFFREDLLSVLDKNQNTNNDIVEEFRGYLQHWESNTQSFKKDKVSEWEYNAHEGYYINLEKELKEEGKECGNYGWQYTNNPAGGFLEFWWAPVNQLKENSCEFGLQIRDCKTLFFRVTAMMEGGEQIPVNSDIRWQLWEQIEQVADRFKGGVKVAWSGRAGGYSATIAQISFDGKEQDSCLVTNQEGMLDFSASVERFRMAIRFLNDVREKVKI